MKYHKHPKYLEHMMFMFIKYDLKEKKTFSLLQIAIAQLTGTVVSLLTYFPTWVFPLMKMPTGGSRGSVSTSRSST